MRTQFVIAWDTHHHTTEELEERVISLENKNAELTVQLKWYEEQFRLSQQRQFGSSSEKTPVVSSVEFFIHNSFDKLGLIPFFY
ncbi:transposase domain-containing protein [Salipaludibacillus sp. CF4.18]|uniref:transposase domain-containing protein n=1 Tax=Salipaludibacillus sp. CF4.18 TaxID=3373081 RepID=UPI003EE5D626